MELGQLEGLIDEKSRAVDAATSGPAAAGADAPENAVGDGEMMGSAIANTMGAVVGIATDVLEAATGGNKNAPASPASSKPASAAAAKKDPLLDFSSPKGNSSFLWAAPVGGDMTVKSNRVGPVDIMSLTSSSADSIFVTPKMRQSARGGNLLSRTNKGHGLDEAVALSAMSLSSPSSGLTVSVGSAPSTAALKAELEGWRLKLQKPSVDLIISAPDDARMVQSLYLISADARDKVEQTWGQQSPTAPQQNASLKPPPPPAPSMSRTG